MIFWPSAHLRLPSLLNPWLLHPPFLIFRKQPRIQRDLCCSYRSFYKSLLSGIRHSLSVCSSTPAPVRTADRTPQLPKSSGWGWPLLVPVYYFIPQVPRCPVVGPWGGRKGVSAVVEGHITSLSQVYLAAFTFPLFTILPIPGTKIMPGDYILRVAG